MVALRLGDLRRSIASIPSVSDYCYWIGLGMGLLVTGAADSTVGIQWRMVGDLGWSGVRD